MSDQIGTLLGIALTCVLFPLAVWVVALVASAENERETGGDWLDAPGDDQGTGWSNFDYIAAYELEDMWSEDE